jgi:hypothetical protein
MVKMMEGRGGWGYVGNERTHTRRIRGWGRTMLGLEWEQEVEEKVRRRRIRK